MHKRGWWRPQGPPGRLKKERMKLTRDATLLTAILGHNDLPVVRVDSDELPEDWQSIIEDANRLSKSYVRVH